MALWMIHLSGLVVIFGITLLAVVATGIFAYLRHVSAASLGAWVTAIILCGAITGFAWSRHGILRGFNSRSADGKTAYNKKKESGLVPLVGERHTNGSIMTIDVMNSTGDDAESLFAYHYDENGLLVCQTREDGRICQRSFDNGAIGLHVEGVGSEAIRNLQINRYWNWLRDIPQIPAGACGIQILAYGFPDTPRPEFDYTFLVLFQIGGEQKSHGMRSRFLQDRNPCAISKRIPDSGGLISSMECLDDARYRPRILKRIEEDYSTGRQVALTGVMNCSRTAEELESQSIPGSKTT